MGAVTPEHQPSPGPGISVGRRVRKRLILALYQRRANVALGGAVAIAVMAFLFIRGMMEGATPADGVAPVAVNVQALAPQGNTLPLVLSEKNGSRQLVIRDMESTEARVIARQQGIEIQGEQPRVYDLISDLIQQVGARVNHVLVAEAERDQFQARISLTSGAERRTIRARPADGVALALKTGAPIYVENAVLERYGGRAAR